MEGCIDNEVLLLLLTPLVQGFAIMVIVCTIFAGTKYQTYSLKVGMMPNVIKLITGYLPTVHLQKMSNVSNH